MSKIKIDCNSGILIEINNKDQRSLVQINNEKIIFKVNDFDLGVESILEVSNDEILINSDCIDMSSNEAIIEVLDSLNINVADSTLDISDELELKSNMVYKDITELTEIKANKVVFE